MIFKKSESW